MDLKLEVTVDEPTILKKKTALTIRIRTVFSDTPNLAAIFIFILWNLKDVCFRFFIIITFSVQWICKIMFITNYLHNELIRVSLVLRHVSAIDIYQHSQGAL